MNWISTTPNRSQIVRTKVDFYYHYGIFISEDEVIRLVNEGSLNYNDGNVSWTNEGKKKYGNKGTVTMSTYQEALKTR